MNMKRTLGLLLLMAMVSIAAMATPAVAEELDLSSTRSISTTEVEAGDTFTVTVVMECTGDNSSDGLTGMQLEETLPYGWTVTENDSSFTSFSDQMPVFTWQDTVREMGPGDTLTIIYDVTVPDLAEANDYSIAGNATAGRNSQADLNPIPLVGGVIGGATTITVTAAAYDPVHHITPLDSLQDTIDNAQAGDTIMMAEGTYTIFTGAYYQSFLYIPKKLTFMAEDGADVTITSDVNDIMGAVLALGLDNSHYGADASGTTFKDISFELPDSGYGSGVLLDIGGSHMYANDPGNVNYSGLTFEDCSFTDLMTIYVQSDSVFKNCTFSSVTYTSSGSTYAPYVQILSDNLTVEGCSGEPDQFFGGVKLLRNNTFDSTILGAGSDSLVCDNSFTDCTFSAGSDSVVRNNEFISSSSITLNGQSYLNTFTDCAIPSGSGVFNTPEEVEYTYRGSSYTSYLGNYYSDYNGTDSDSNGIGEDVYGSDTYPLMGAWDDASSEIESDLVILWSGEVTLMNENFDPSSIDAAAGDSWCKLTDLGALVQTGLDIDADYTSSLGTFWINDIGNAGGSDWGILVNGETTSYGLGGNDLEDGDVVGFYAPLWAQDATGTWFASEDNANYCVIIEVHDDSPVKAIRTIETQTFMQDSTITTAQSNVTLVTIEFEALKDLESLALMEEVPEDWILTATTKSGASFRECPDADDTYEWVWADSMEEGDTVSISYTIQIPYNESESIYEFTGFVSAIVDGVDINGINVDGDDYISIEADWNPWDDIGSDSDEYVTTAELQQAINCWLYDEPAPTTGARITTDRLQTVISQWLESP
ncbi:MAG: hypothetical protein PWQ51_358 [Methanolobus sp.]|nr:hypothetical protein [Methanolobus sp.]MDK2938194.1 hypothetical protein [Methanolobus sp.]